MGKCWKVEWRVRILGKKWEKEVWEKEIVEVVSKGKRGVMKGLKGKKGKGLDGWVVVEEELNVGF